MTFRSLFREVAIRIGKTRALAGLAPRRLLGLIGILATPIAPGLSERSVVADPRGLDQRNPAARGMSRAKRAMDAVDSQCAASNGRIGRETVPGPPLTPYAKPEQGPGTYDALLKRRS